MKPNDNCWCPIIVKNSRIPKLLSWFIDVRAITLFPFIFIKDEGDDRILNHESIHIAQQRETLVLGFYILYLWDFIIGAIRFKSGRDAYYSIRFEREAYANDHDKYYLEYRKLYAWRKYKV